MGLLFKHGGLEAWGDEQLAPHYSAGWAWAGNAPFDWGKQVASHLGGTRNPMVVHWPSGIGDAGAVRSHYTHVNDVGATILDLAGIPMPDTIDGVAQQPFDGVDLRRLLRGRGARRSGTRSSTTRSSATGGCTRTAGCSRSGCSGSRGTSTRRSCAQFGPGWNPDDEPIELYYLPDDFTQSKNVAADHPEKVKELSELFWAEAEANNVLPLLGGLTSFFGMVPPLPEDSKFVFRGDIQNIPSGMIPRIYNHSYTISADLVVPEGGAEGVIVAEADHLGGFSLFVQDGKLKHTYSMLGVLEYTQAAEQPLPTGEVNVELVFTADAPKPATGGEVTLLVNGEPVASGRMEHTVPGRFSGYSGMDIGRDNGLVVDLSYADKAPFAFTGEIKQVVFDVAPHLSEEDATGAATSTRLRPWRPTRRAPERRRERSTMSDNDQLDVLIAVYLIPDLAQQDFDALRQARRRRRDRHRRRRARRQGRRGRGARPGDRRPPRPQGRQGRRRRRPRRRALRAAAPGGDRRWRRRRRSWPGSSRATACRRASARRWTTRFPPGRPGSSRSTSTTEPTPSTGALAQCDPDARPRRSTRPRPRS